MLLTVSYVIAGFIVLASIYLGISTDLLKNNSPAKKTSYSFSKVQLMWWTIIISSAFIILFAKTDKYDFFNQSALLLLSISLVTTAGASVIDVSQNQSGKSLHQHRESQGFFYDILSDENGISMHRLQTLIFNVVFGITFIVSFWTNQAFPEFNPEELSLLGVSSGAYLALKTNENKINNILPTTTP